MTVIASSTCTKVHDWKWHFRILYPALEQFYYISRCPVCVCTKSVQPGKRSSWTISQYGFAKTSIFFWVSPAGSNKACTIGLQYKLAFSVERRKKSVFLPSFPHGIIPLEYQRRRFLRFSGHQKTLKRSNKVGKCQRIFSRAGLTISG